MQFFHNLAPVLLLALVAGIAGVRNTEYGLGKGLGLFVGGLLLYSLLGFFLADMEQAHLVPIAFAAVMLIVLVVYGKFGVFTATGILVIWGAALYFAQEPIEDAVDYMIKGVQSGWIRD